MVKLKFELDPEKAILFLAFFAVIGILTCGYWVWWFIFG
jgi:hypothetical protein